MRSEFGGAGNPRGGDAAIVCCTVDSVSDVGNLNPAVVGYEFKGCSIGDSDIEADSDVFIHERRGLFNLDGESAFGGLELYLYVLGELFGILFGFGFGGNGGGEVAVADLCAGDGN